MKFLKIRLKVIYVLVILNIFMINKYIFANNINELLSNKVLAINTEYNYENFLNIINKSTEDIVFKSIITGIEISKNHNENKILQILKNYNANYIKVLYYEDNVVYIDIFKNNNFKDIVLDETVLNVKNDESEKKTNDQTVKISTESYISIVSTISELVKNNEPIEIEYFDKLYNTYEERIEISNLILNIKNNDFESLINNLSLGNYKDLLNIFINNYDDLYDKLSKLFDKTKYKSFSETFKNDLSSNYKDLYNSYLSFIGKNDLNDITKKYQQINLITNIFNNNNGLFDSFKDEFINKNMNSLLNLLQEFIDGKYSYISEDFIINFIDITKNYGTSNINDIIEISTKSNVIYKATISEILNISSTSNTIEISTKSEIENKNHTNKSNSIISIIIKFLILILIIGLVILIIKLKKRISENQIIDDEEENNIDGKGIEQNEEEST